MFKPGTLFIVGAGASSELDMPQGDDFKRLLSEKIDIKFDGGQQFSGDYEIYQAIKKHAEDTTASLNTSAYVQEAWNISNALPLVSSIDSYIEMRKDNEKIELISKLGIIRTILEAEQKSKLYYKEHEKRDFSSTVLTTTWLASFTRILVSGISVNEVENIFNDIAIICFNYDRCIEQFLALALQFIYSIEEKQARDIVKKLRIYHPYGKVGDLPWSDGNIYDITYGKEINSAQLLEQSKKIKTYSEQLEEKTGLNDIKDEVKNAETLIFLGMAYHKQNLDLLMPTEQTSVEYIYGTSLGISDSDTPILKNDLSKFLSNKRALDLRIKLKSISCSEFFSEYYRNIAKI